MGGSHVGLCGCGDQYGLKMRPEKQPDNAGSCEQLIM